MPDYMKKRDSFNQKAAPKPDTFGLMFTEMLQELIVTSSMGAWVLLKSFGSKWAFVSVPVTVGLWFGCYHIAAKGLHILWIHQLEPRFLTLQRLDWMFRIPTLYHTAVLYGLVAIPTLSMIGVFIRSTRTKFQKLFESIGLTNGLGDTPKLIRTQRLDNDRKSYIFDPNSVPIREFQQHTDQIEAAFKTNIESITFGKDKSKVIITVTKHVFPDKVNYLDLTTQVSLPPESFYLGENMEGILTQDVAELPHLLIAGTTGSGKSVFFKQALLGLLESSPYLQMYLIDLKSGLEMIDFVKAPNVKVVKTMDDAVALLRKVEKEMKARFDYLEATGRKKIIPGKDQKDRIIVAVDEASVLYMNRTRHDPEYESALEARRLADSISKLSRAAAINLLLATQKLDRQVIPTSVSENISGRMAFRANSLQGSLVVLGTKDASELPDIAGRGIWNFGTKKFTIQAPFVDEKTIKQRCAVIAEQFQKGKKKMLSPMLGEAAKAQVDNVISDAYDQLGVPDEA